MAELNLQALGNLGRRECPQIVRQTGILQLFQEANELLRKTKTAQSTCAHPPLTSSLSEVNYAASMA